MTAGFGVNSRADTYYKKQELHPEKVRSCSHNTSNGKSHCYNIALS